MDRLLEVTTTLLAICLAATTAARAQGDARAAQDQYRVARRLAAEGSPQAAAALRKVVELDPRGVLADDALLNLAQLIGPAAWPDELGQVSPPAAAQALAVLDELLRDHAGGDRESEARLALSLLLLEPLPTRDAERARIALLSLATAERGSWSWRARFVLAWLDELQGRTDRARDAYQRLYLEAADPRTAGRAAMARGRLLLPDGEFGAAAVWIERALRAAEVPPAEGIALRELAVRGLLAGRGEPWWVAPPGRTATATPRDPALIARLPDGGLLVGDRRAESVVRLAGDGSVVARWSLPDLSAIAVGPFGRAFAASDGRIHLLREGSAEALAGQGDFDPVSSLAIDRTGAMWIADRRGERVGRIDPGGATPTEIWRSRSIRLAGLAWDGQRLIGLDVRGGRLLALAPDGTTRTLVALQLQRPARVAAASEGLVAVLDSRAGQVVLFGSQGTELSRLDTETVGVERAADLAVGPDGSLDLLDEAGGFVARLP